MDNGLAAGITSIKGAFQAMAPEQVRLIECEVTREPPNVELRACNDEKLIIPAALIILPERLTDQVYPCYIEVQTEWTCIYPYNACDAEKHAYTTDQICIHNALRAGEHVYVLALGGGKIYYVLDRVPRDKTTLAEHGELCRNPAVAGIPKVTVTGEGEGGGDDPPGDVEEPEGGEDDAGTA